MAKDCPPLQPGSREVEWEIVFRDGERVCRCCLFSCFVMFSFLCFFNGELTDSGGMTRESNDKGDAIINSSLGIIVKLADKL